MDSSTGSGHLSGVSMVPIVKIYDSLLEAMTSLDSSDSSSSYGTIKAFGTLPSLVFALQALSPNYTASFLAHPLHQHLELACKAQTCDASLPASSLNHPSTI
ncbi:hypothetical protein BDW69DRAFT_158406 [Aspergillus filifer]